MKKLAYILGFILLFSCAGKLGESGKSRVTGYIQSELVNEGYAPFNKISLDPTRRDGLSDLHWYLINFDTGPPAQLLSTEELPLAGELMIPASLKGRKLITFTATTTKQKTIVGTPVELITEQNIPDSPEKLYLTLNRPELTLGIYGSLLDARTPSGKALEKVYQYGDYTFYTLHQPGFYQLTGKEHRLHPKSINVFVSPIKSIHTGRTDRDWYFTQFRTSTTSNCGPTVVSMSIAWSTGKTVSVSQVRDHIGWVGSGAVNFLQMQAVLNSYDIESEILDFKNKEQIFDLINRDKLIGVVYNMAGLSYQKDPAHNMFDQYYIDHGGHYLAIKGYSADKKYFIIYDPIPSNWRTNAERYSDGISMYGRNRYYLATELIKAMIRPQILVIHRG